MEVKDLPSSTCGTAEDGAMCAIDCACRTTVAIEASQTLTTPPQAGEFWQKARLGLAFVVACLASPCCTPLIVPLLLALAAGTPAAIWLSQNLGWVYGGLTLVSALSFALAWRWMKKRDSARLPVLTFSGEGENHG